MAQSSPPPLPAHAVSAIQYNPQDSQHQSAFTAASVEQIKATDHENVQEESMVAEVWIENEAVTALQHTSQSAAIARFKYNGPLLFGVGCGCQREESAPSEDCDEGHHPQQAASLGCVLSLLNS